MRIGLVLSLLAHASAGGAAWWLLGARGDAETAFPTLHVRSATLDPVEPEDPPVPAPPRPALPDEPIDAVEPEPVDDLELDVQSVEELAPAWPPDRTPLTRRVGLRRPNKAEPAPAKPEAKKAPRRSAPRVRPAKGSKLVAARPRKGKTPPARYPSRARRLGKTGTVVLRARVGIEGSVTRVEVLASSGTASLDKAAIGALRLWLFAAATRGGKPVAQWVRVPFRFELRSGR